MNMPHTEERQPGELVAPVIAPNACDFCHADIASDAVFHRLTIGLNADGPPGSAGTAVEETSELLCCAVCQPAVEAIVDRMLEGLWRIRKDDPRAAQASHLTVISDEPEVEPEAFATPYGITDAESVAAGAEMLAVAARAYPSSPEGFALGIVVGRMLREGLGASDIHGLVDGIIHAPTNRRAEAEA